MRWLWILLPLFLLIACSDDAPQDTPPPSREDDTGASDDLCADGACDLADSRSKHGSRLQVLNQDWIGEDGSVIEQPAVAFDTKYGVKCFVQQWGDNVWRCYPEATTLNLSGYFSDPECRTSLIRKDNVMLYACDETAEFFRTAQSDQALICNIETTKIEFYFYFIPEGLSSISWESPDKIYQKTSDGCEEYSRLEPSDYYIFTPMEQYRIPDDDFVRMER